MRFLLAKKPELKSKILEIVQRILKKYINEKCGTQKLEIGTVTFIQRFGGSLNLNPHLHMLVLDGCYDRRAYLEILATSKISPSASGYC